MTDTQIVQPKTGTDTGDQPSPEDIGKPLAATIAGHHRHAILILDARGVIRFAATRGMFGRSDEDLVDRHLQSVVPTIPLRRTTPGYNVAYVRLNFAERGWQRHRAASAGRGGFSAEISLRPLAIGHSYAFLAAVREARAGERIGASRRWPPLLRPPSAPDW